MENQTIINEQTYLVSPGIIWKAITSKEEMKIWYFDLQDLKAEVAFEFQFMGGPTEDRQYLHRCIITEVIPLKKLSYSWLYDGYVGNTTLTFELFAEGEHTRLKLIHEGLETLPASNPDLARENFVIGWNWIIGTSLKEFLEKK